MSERVDMWGRPDPAGEYVLCCAASPGGVRHPSRGACGICRCRSQGCTEKAGPSGHCEFHVGYYIEREEGWAERDLKRELEGMERRIVELAALLVAPCNRALGMLRKARAAQWSERESRGWTPSISLEEAATDYELDGLTGGTEILVREYVGRRGEPWEYSEVEQTPAEIRDLIRRAVEEITDLVRPAATTGTEMFRRPEGAEVLDEVGFSDMVRRAAIYVEALDE